MSGTVVVVGSAQNYEFDDDILTVAYDAAGTKLWSAEIAGPRPRGDDRASGVAIDSVRGRIYVTASISAELDRSNALTVAYDLTGRELWRAEFDEGREEYIGAPVVDPVSGLIYAGGSSAGEAVNVTDALLLAYTPTGNLAWSRRLGFAPYEDEVVGAPVLAPDGGGVYLQGYSDGGLVVALDARGHTRWLAQVPAGQASAVSTGLVISPDGGQLYLGLGDGFDIVTITALGTVDGSLRWSRVVTEAIQGAQLSVLDLVVDPSTGNVFTAVRIGYLAIPRDRYSTVISAFAPDGSLSWARTLLDPGQSVFGEHLAVDPVGDQLVVVGSTSTPRGDTFSDLLVVTLDTATGGAPASFTYSGAPYHSAQGRTVTVDPVGRRAYIAGVLSQDDTYEDVLVLAFDLD